MKKNLKNLKSIVRADQQATPVSPSIQAKRLATYTIAAGRVEACKDGGG